MIYSCVILHVFLYQQQGFVVLNTYNTMSGIWKLFQNSNRNWLQSPLEGNKKLTIPCPVFQRINVYLLGPLSWYNPRWPLSPTPQLIHTPAVGWGKRIRRVKVREFIGWDKDSLIVKAKAGHARKTRNSFMTSHGWAGVQSFPGKPSSITHSGYFGIQTP